MLSVSLTERIRSHGFITYTEKRELGIKNVRQRKREALERNDKGRYCVSITWALERLLIMTENLVGRDLVSEHGMN